MNKYNKPLLGFTVGVWDLLHEGHLDLLQRCKNQCDYLIVAIMNDYWVMVQKGIGRPKQPLQLRYNILKDQNICDKIIILDTLDMTPYLQICDIWFKGEDQIKMKPDNFSNIIIIKHNINISTTKLLNVKKGNK